MTLSDLLTILTIGFIVVATIYVMSLRRKEGHAQSTVVPQYEPPEGLPPIALSQIMDGRIEMRDIVAEVIDLANKGYIRIENNNDSITLFRVAGTQPLITFETKFLDKLFSGIDGVVLEYIISPSSGIIPAITELLREYLIKEVYPKYYDTKSISKSAYGIVLGFVLVFVALFIGEYALPVLLLGIFLMVASSSFVQKNSGGHKLKHEILGFIEYIKVAESDRLAFHNSPEKTQERFDKLLSYAIALGQEKAWLGKFGELNSIFAKEQVSPGGVMDKLRRKNLI